jgi:hypothetical protein
VSDPNLTSVITYRAFTADDLPAAHALSTAVRWRHRPEDWRFAARIGEGIVAVERLFPGCSVPMRRRSAC